MAAYEHFQIVKKAENLPDPKKIGACLTCKFWDVQGARGQGLVNHVALCVFPQLEEFNLIVSGGSGCNRWQKQPGVSPEAEAYAKLHEEEK